MSRRPPAQNRVTPGGEIIATTGRGGWMGNRGRLHEAHPEAHPEARPEGRGTRTIVRAWRTRAWITCVLEFRGRRVSQWAAHHYTPLFFFDEAVALAAGHRPCAECRHGAYLAFRDAYRETATGPAPALARDIDARLHRQRTAADRPRMPWTSLPDGVFVATDDGPAVVIGDELALFDADAHRYGYRPGRLARPSTGSVAVLTPAATVAVLTAGYRAQIDGAARKP